MIYRPETACPVIKLILESNGKLYLVLFEYIGLPKKDIGNDFILIFRIQLYD